MKEIRLTTPVAIPASQHPIDYSSTLFSVGSCFAVNMGEKFAYYKFRSTVNPFGILFHPLAIDQMVYRAVNNQKFTEADIFFKDGLWRCYEVHSEMNHSDQSVMLENLNSALEATLNTIRRATHFIITYGTAWVYREVETQSVVANCHKVAAANFRKEILSVDMIEGAIQSTLSMILAENPSAKILLTISPVRHTKDGVTENQRSKANLLAALHQVLDQQADSVMYFPSYEIMMDELRDYRFYNADMLHPNGIAIDYIWQKFAGSQIAPASIPVMEKVASVQKALAHRPQAGQTNEHDAHLAKVQKMIEELRNDFPDFNF